MSVNIEANRKPERDCAGVHAERTESLMKLVTFRQTDTRDRLGVLVDADQRVVDCSATVPDDPALASMQALLDAGEPGLRVVRELAHSAPSIPLAEVRLRPPVPVPAQIRDFLCFEEHLRCSFEVGKKIAVAQAEDPEAMQQRATEQGLFDIPASWYVQPLYYKGNRFACSGHGDDIHWPAYSSLMDYELELGCWIGTAGADIPAERAHEHIFGYSIFNDFSARDAQVPEMSGGLGPAKGKDFDGANAIGPCIVTADAIDPDNLTMIARVNGEEWSRGNSATMHWKFADVIAHASRSETLHPGELIGSGTVGGGCGLEHERFLSSGDIVELEIEGIGVLRNRVLGSQ